ncbi:MAG: hypothetical protein E5X58_38795, partial [Mesorhizobium sp.]
ALASGFATADLHHAVGHDPPLDKTKAVPLRKTSGFSGRSKRSHRREMKRSQLRLCLPWLAES